jgi:DNA-binding NtrC family response regulator
VTRGAFTGVDARTGALEAADAGTLFLDEVHALPLRVQRSLLRFVEDGLVEPLGQTATGPRRRLDVRLVFGTNVDVEEACEKGWLAHDLVARLHRVEIPPLRERRADVPSLFLAVLRRTVDPAAAQALVRELRVEAVERLCLYDFRVGNVRELVRLAAIAAARLAEGESPVEALRGAMRDALGERPSTAAPPPAASSHDAPGPEAASSYERHKAEILAAYAEVGGNLSRMEAMLKQRGVPCTRRWLAHFLDRWGVRPIPKRG